MSASRRVQVEPLAGIDGEGAEAGGGQGGEGEEGGGQPVIRSLRK